MKHTSINNLILRPGRGTHELKNVDYDMPSRDTTSWKREGYLDQVLPRFRFSSLLLRLQKMYSHSQYDISKLAHRLQSKLQSTISSNYALYSRLAPFSDELATLVRANLDSKVEQLDKLDHLDYASA